LDLARSRRSLAGLGRVETQRLCVARKQLAASETLRQATSQRVEVAQLKYAQAQTLVREK